MKHIYVLVVFAVYLLNRINCQYPAPNLAHLYKGYKLPGLIEFGPIYGDRILPKKDDGSSKSIQFPFEFPFFHKTIKNFYVNTNGIISFGTKLDAFHDINRSENISYISVYGSDVDTRYNGNIYHREVVDQNSLRFLDGFVNKYVNLIENIDRDENGNHVNHLFTSSWGYLVTWYNVEPHRRYNELANNTFQAAIFTDGINSFCLLQYLNLTWPNAILKSSIKIGLNIDPIQNLLIENTHQAEFSISKNSEILSKLVQRSNMNYERGRWLFRLDKRDLTLEEPFLGLDRNNNGNRHKSSLLQSKIDDFNRLSNIQVGKKHGDSELPKNDDGFIEAKFKTPIKFPLYNEKNDFIKSIFVHTNGIISFDQELSYSGEISSELTKDKRFIVPLWSDSDTRSTGQILYREILDLDSLSGLISDIKDFAKLKKDFKPKWAFTVSWINVEPYRNRNPLQKNSFQTILFTDNESSYVYFQYSDLNWPNRNLHKNIQAGFNINSNHSYLLKNFNNDRFSLDLSRSLSKKILDKLLYSSNMKKSGKWIFAFNEKNGNTNDFMKPN